MKRKNGEGILTGRIRIFVRVGSGSIILLHHTPYKNLEIKIYVLGSFDDKAWILRQAGASGVHPTTRLGVFTGITTSYALKISH